MWPGALRQAIWQAYRGTRRRGLLRREREAVAARCGQVADDGEGPKAVDLPLGYPPPLGNRHPFPGNGDHFSGFHFPGEPRADSTQGLLHCLPIAGEHGAGLLYEDAP